jgi:hypothetical protein
MPTHESPQQPNFSNVVDVEAALGSRAAERLFPTLTAQQLSRVAARGRRRATTAGELLFDVGASPVPFFVVVSGAVRCCGYSKAPRR